MRILVTGSSGFVGTHLVESLRKKYKVTLYDLKDGYNILDEKTLSKKLKGCDAVIHLAAYVSALESWQKPYEYFENNGIGTLKVVRESINKGVKRIINFSSAAVYGRPLTPYGASKLWGETVCNTYKDKIEIITLRPFNIYGSVQNSTYDYAIYNFIDGINNFGSVEIYGDGKQSRDFVDIKDVVNATIKLLTLKKIPHDPIDLGTGKETKIGDLAKLIGKITKKDFDVKYKPSRKEIRKSVAKIKYLKNIGVDVSRFVRLEDGLKRLIKHNEN